MNAPFDHVAVLRTYQGSDGEATKALYEVLNGLGPIGTVAVNLFRACKSSERAKVYRGGERGRGSYRRMAYDRKQWSLDNLCATLAADADQFGIRWGWGIDLVLRDRDDPHHHVLYVDLPTGQVSFHSGVRGNGPDYPGQWDGQPGQSAGRICAWISRLIVAEGAAA